MDRTVDFLKDFEAASDQLRLARAEALPLIDADAIFNELSDNSGRYIRFNAFNVFLGEEEGSEDLFDEFVTKGDPGMTLAGFKSLLGFDLVPENRRSSNIDQFDSYSICRTFLVTFCSLYFSTERVRRSIITSRSFTPTKVYRRMRQSPPCLHYADFATALFSGLAHSYSHASRFYP